MRLGGLKNYARLHSNILCCSVHMRHSSPTIVWFTWHHVYDTKGKKELLSEKKLPWSKENCFKLVPADRSLLAFIHVAWVTLNLTSYGCWSVFWSACCGLIPTFLPHPNPPFLWGTLIHNFTHTHADTHTCIDPDVTMCHIQGAVGHFFGHLSQAGTKKTKCGYHSHTRNTL